VLRDSPRILCIASLAEAPLEQRIEAAITAGFDGITIWRQHWQDALDRGLDAAGIRALMRPPGSGAVMAEALVEWWKDPRRDADAAKEAAQLFALASAMGASSVGTVLIDSVPRPLAQLARAFRSTCELAAAHGLELGLEFLPWSAIDTLPSALEVVESAGCANGKLVIDSWHWARSGSSLDGFDRLSPDQVVLIQLNDAPATPHPDVLHETMHERLLPGEGEIDLRALLGALDARGVRCPVAAEVFSDRIAALPVCEAARELWRSLDSVLD
jgi:sugar phosphate isomerase/epimerase